MVVFSSLREMGDAMSGIIQLNPDKTLTVADPSRFRGDMIDALIETAVFSDDASIQEAARWLIWECGHALGVHSASIQELYLARGRGLCNGFTVPAINIRGLTYETARAMFRAAHNLKVGPFVFEIARSEMGYTLQRPAEYSAHILAAAIKENHHGPVFIQGDHFQFNVKQYREDAQGVTQGIRDLIVEAIDAGFYNIDIDSSTLVDLSFPTLAEQQKVNSECASAMTAWIRKHEPHGITISVGGEIGEVGLKNSTVDELRAYMDGYLKTLREIGPDLIPISKVSVQTGTSHGGNPTAGGQVAEVTLDFQVLKELSAFARDEYGQAGAVQHGASTLPNEMFDEFPKVETAEIHLATGFQNMLFDGDFLPDDLKTRMYAWIDDNLADERKEGQTDEQFHYKTRKKTYGPFKRDLWEMSAENRGRYCRALQDKFQFLFRMLAVEGTWELVQKYVRPVLVHRPQAAGIEQVFSETAST